MKRGTPRHPKTLDLEDRLVKAGVPQYLKHPCALGILEALWHFAAEFAPQGDVGRFPNKRIAGACGWLKNEDVLVDILLASGWLDSNCIHRLVVHDWSEHADDAVRKRLQRTNLPFVSNHTDTPKVTGHRQTLSTSQPDNGSLPEPLPEPDPKPEPLIPTTETKTVSVVTPSPKPAKPPRKSKADLQGWPEWKLADWRTIWREDPKAFQAAGAMERFGAAVKTEEQGSYLVELHRRQIAAANGGWWPGLGAWMTGAIDAMHAGLKPEEVKPPDGVLVIQRDRAPTTFGEARERRQAEIFDELLAREVERGAIHQS